MSLLALLALLALVAAVASAANRAPLWVSVILLCLIVLIQVWR